MGAEHGPNLFKQPEKAEPKKTSWEKLKENIGRVFKAENGYDGPPVSIDIYFSAHGSAIDIKSLAEQFKSADIYILERPDWTKEELVHFNELSRGEKTPVEVSLAEGFGNAVEGSFMGAQWEMVYKSNKKIALLDLPHGHPLIKRYQALGNRGVIIENTFAETLHKVKERDLEFANIQREREKYIMGQLKASVTKIINNSPALKQKDAIKVLMLWGDLHTTFYHALKKVHKDTARRFSTSPVKYPYAAESARRYMSGKDVSDDLAARVWLDNLISDAAGYYLQYATRDSSKISQFVRKAVNTFSLDEIERVYEECRPLDRHSYYIATIKQLKQKGIPIPRMEEELESFLAKKN